MLTGFYLLRNHNVFFGTYVAVAINVAAFLLAMILASFVPHRVKEEPEEITTSPRPTISRVPYFVIALSGFTALGAEVVWTRQLGLILGGTVYTFSIILGVFLAGLGIGSSVGSILARDSKHPKWLLGLCQLLLIAAIAWTAYALAVSLPYWPIDPRLAQSPWVMFQSDMSRTLWAIFPATLLWGASFPLALASAAGPGQDPGRLVGGVYAANTVGAISGALAFSLFISPKLGGQGAQRLLIVIAAIAALAVFVSAMVPAWKTRVGRRKPVWVETAVAVLLLIGMTYFFSKNVKAAPWGLIAHGRYFPTQVHNLVPGITPIDQVEYSPPYETTWAIYEGEGVNGNVVVTESASGTRSFHAAGKTQASNDPLDMKLQRMLGHLSALAIDKPKSVLVVACGAGVTAGTFLLHPTIERIVIVDIEELVPKYVTPYFSYENYKIADGLVDDVDNILEFEIGGRKKTVEYVFDDGRHYLRTTKEKFDIISSDPIDPWVKGKAALNTVEYYYQMARGKLNPGGVMSLWIPLYESNLATFKSVVGTFFTVFEEGVLWSNDHDGFGYDAVLFGQLGGTRFDIDKLQERLSGEWRVRESLEEVGLHSAMDLLSTFAAYAPQAREWMKDASINYDRDLKLQYLAGFNLNTWEENFLLQDLRAHLRFPSDMFTGSAASMAELRKRMNVD